MTDKELINTLNTAADSLGGDQLPLMFLLKMAAERIERLSGE